MIVYILSLVCAYTTGFNNHNIDLGQEVYLKAESCLKDREDLYKSKKLQEKCTVKLDLQCKRKEVQ